MKVLDNGEVTLIDSMAGDHKVFGSARVSTGATTADASKGDASDQKLIDFLMSNGHGSPFEHSVFQWFIKAPIFVIREWHRHRIASYNEQSGRYAQFDMDFYIPDHVRVQDPNNKQSTIVSDDQDLLDQFQFQVETNSNFAYSRYQQLLKRGVGREMARMVLPVNLYSRFWFTVDARSLMNFLELRNAASAQWEIQQYAKALETDFMRLMPMTWLAFNNNGRKTP